MASVLVVDDDRELCDLLADYLTAEGFVVASSHDGSEAVDRILYSPPDLVVLDVMLPSLTGFDVLRRIRPQAAVPVIMLTARGDDADKIVGLELGADDYLPKPFNPRELLARIRAVLRRLQKGDGGSTPLVSGDVVLDMTAQTVHVADVPVRLTAVEFALLELFLRNADRVLSRDELSRTVLGRELTQFDRAIDVHVSNLRKKLGPTQGTDERIRTVRGKGYRYLAPPAEQV